MGRTKARLFPLKGAIELHSEAPDVEFLQLAAAAGLREVVIKWPGGADSAPAAELANGLTVGPRIWGGVVLDRAVGGMNTAAVAACASRRGRFIWMPTVDALNHRRINGLSEDGVVHVLDSRGALAPEVRAVLQAAGEHQMIVGTGHLGPDEVEQVIAAAFGCGVRKVIVNHPLLLGFSLDTIKRIAACGEVFIEHCYVPNYPKTFDLGRIVEAVAELPPAQSVIADFGKFGEDANIADALVAYGMNLDLIRTLAETNPARVLADG
jgi:hypothetical protein